MKRIYVLLAVLLTLLCVASCDNDATPQTSATEPTQTEAKKTTPAKTTKPKEIISPESDTAVAIHVNQVGYLPNSVKRAIVTEGGHDFYLVEAKTGKIVYQGKVEVGKFDENSGDNVNYADFSEYTTPGEYYVYVNGVYSYPFEISADIYDNVLDVLLKSYYYQRCGVELTEEYAGKLAHAACHTAPVALISDDDFTPVTITGGWHDAGDYGKYMDTSTITVGKLLYAFILFPDAFDDELGIPESGNGIPDVLDEAKFELEWMLKMQREDGGVYAEQKSETFTNWGMPEDDPLPIYLYDVDISSTASFCASVALAARVYKGHDDAFAQKCADAAKLSWEWVKADNTPSIDERGYKNSFYDERAWAAAEMYMTFGEKDHISKLQTYHSRMDTGYKYFMYNNMGGFVAMAVTLNTEKRDFPTELLNSCKWGLQGGGESAHDHYLSNPYEVAYADGYGALSNSEFGMEGMRMILAMRARKSLQYTDVITETMNYVLGKNALSVSYITGLGDLSVTKPHHRLSYAAGYPAPGLVVGGAVTMKTMGPKHAETSPSIYNYLTDDTPDMKSYAHDHNYWYFNEPTIYTNASFVFIAAYLAALEK